RHPQPLRIDVHHHITEVLAEHQPRTLQIPPCPISQPGLVRIPPNTIEPRVVLLIQRIRSKLLLVMSRCEVEEVLVSHCAVRTSPSPTPSACTYRPSQSWPHTARAPASPATPA